MSAQAEELRAAQDSATSDEAIVARVVAGNTALFEVLMRRHNRRVYRAARSVLRDEAEVEDVMQQSYLSAYAHLAQFTGAARFTTWLLKIVLHEALARRRRAARLEITDFDAEENATMSDEVTRPRSPEQRAANRELAAMVEEAVDRLPEGYRTVFVLREVEEMATAEVAQALEVTEDVVKTRLHRAKALVRKELDARIGAAASSAFPFQDPRCDRVVGAVLARILGG